MREAWLFAKNYGPSKVIRAAENTFLTRLGIWMTMTYSILVAFGKMIKAC